MAYSNSQDIQSILKQVFKTEGFINPQVKIQDGSKAGDGYMAANYSVQVESKGEILKIFVKAMPGNLDETKSIVRSIFDREIRFYKEIYPVFLKFQTERNVSVPFNGVPKCYAVSTVEERRFLAMENLKEQGYELFDRKKKMNSEHICFDLKNYARFHAISYALKDQLADVYANLCEGLDDILVETMEEHGMDIVIGAYAEDIPKMFTADDDPQILNKVSNIKEVLVNTLRESNKYVDEYSVIIHGDCWCNNMMFYYENYSEKICPSKMKILDWQVFRINSPVLDLSNFFYTVCTKEAMNDLDHYLKVYYDTLSEQIAALGSDPRKTYPVTVFREHWIKYSKYGLAVSLVHIKVMLTEEDEVVNLSDEKKMCETFIYTMKNDELYKKRIKDIVEHFINNNLL